MNATQGTDASKQTGKGKKKGEPEPVIELPLKPVFDYGGEVLDEAAEQIWDARDRMN